VIVTERGMLLDFDNKRDILTGTLVDGTASGSDCAGWTSDAALDEATVGHVHQGPDNWANQHERNCDVLGIRCNGAGNVYCFEL
jgi:hypothetical protein